MVNVLIIIYQPLILYIKLLFIIKSKHCIIWNNIYFKIMYIRYSGT